MAKNTANKEKVYGLIVKAIAVLIAAALVAYGSVSIALGTGNPLKWKAVRQTLTASTNGGDDEGNGGDEDTTKPSGGELINPTENNGISLTAEKIAVEDYAEYGIDTHANTAYTITATVNADAVDKSVVGAIGWQNASSEWANGKDLSEFATLTQTEKYGLNFTLTVKQAFGEPITVKVMALSDSTVFGTCRVDYLKELKSFTATLNPSLNSASTARLYVGNKKNAMQITPTYYTGTLEGNISECNTTFTFHDTARSQIDNALKNIAGTGNASCKTSFTCNGLEFTVPMSAMCTSWGDGQFLYGVNTALNNYFYNNAYTDEITTSAGYTCAITNISVKVTYAYGEYTKTVTKDIGLTYINKTGLNYIATISDIELGGDIVVVPQ